MKKITPITITNKETQDVVSVYFDVTLIVNRENKLIVVDNNVDNWLDYVDDNTLSFKRVNINID